MVIGSKVSLVFCKNEAQNISASHHRMRVNVRAQ